MELGVHSLSDLQSDAAGGPIPTAGERIAQIIVYGCLAEDAGLDIFGVGEHHAPEFAVSSPAVVLAAVAQATQRIRFTTTATVLSTLDPVRVYQDFATLDLISGGRAELTAGRSAFAEPFALFGEDIANYDELFAEKLDLLLQIRGEGPVTWFGRFRPSLHGVAVAPRTRADLPVWVGVGGTPASAVRAGTLGLPMFLGLIGGSITQARRIVDIYREAGARAGHSPDTLKLGISSHFFTAASGQGARDSVYPYYRQYLAPKTPGGRGWNVSREQMEAASGPGAALVVGGPEEVAEKIVDLHRLLGADRFMGQVDFGGLPPRLVEESIRVFGEQVAPLVRHELG